MNNGLTSLIDKLAPGVIIGTSLAELNDGDKMTGALIGGVAGYMLQPEADPNLAPLYMTGSTILALVALFKD